jgi:hypothetical protein
MSRSRNIKPGFFRNADLVELPVETRLLFIGLWGLADREGRMSDRPKQIKMEIYPADSFDVDDMLGQLHRAKFIERYTVNEINYIQIVNFTKHQNPHRDEKASTIPAPCLHGANTVAIGLIPDSLLLKPETLPSGESGCKSPREPEPETLPPARAGLTTKSQIVDDFEPDVANARTALSHSLDLAAERERFVAHYQASGEWRANWQAQFRKWLLDSMQRNAENARRDQARQGRAPPGGGKQAGRDTYAAAAAAAETELGLNTGAPHDRPAERDITADATRIA